MSTAIKLFFSNAWSFLLPIIKLFLSSAGPILAKAAQDAVTAVALNYGSSDGAVKRQVAFDLIQSTLVKEGIKLGTSAINVAIETAVQRFKAGE